MKVVNLTRRATIADNVIIADTFFKRMVGLLTRSSIGNYEALVITRCRSIHMFFMRFPIDAIFLGKNNKVVGVVKHLKPNRLSPIFWSSQTCIELSAGRIEASATELGDLIEIQ